MRIFIFLIMFSASNVLADDPLRLACYGEAITSSNDISTVNTNNTTLQSGVINQPSTTSTITTRRTNRSSVGVTIHLEEDDNWIEIPSSLLPGINKAAKLFKKDKSNKFELYKLKKTDEAITAKFKLNTLNRPSVKLDRYTGMMSFSGLGTDFNGNCSRVDLLEKKF